MMRMVIHATGRLDHDQIQALRDDNHDTIPTAVRRAITGTYRTVLRTHPAIDPWTLMVDLTWAGGGVAWVIHQGQHVPSVINQPYTRRHRAADYIAGREGEVI